jgi:competence protein ComEC
MLLNKHFVVIDMKVLAILCLILTACQVIPVGQVTAPLETPSGTLTVDYLDIGQGDSTLITLPNHKTILIDCGNTGKGSAVIEALKKRTSAVDLLIGTHADADHIGGCDEVMAGFPVRSVLENGQAKDTKAYRDFHDDAVAVGERILVDDEELSLDSSVGLRLMMAYDDQGMSDDANDNSIVLRLDYGTRSFLFTGDCEEACEEVLIDTENVDVDVYKAGHHGSKTSSNAAFLREVTPSVAIISAGANNKYGHPNLEALERMHVYTDNIFTTIDTGTITVTTDGTELTVKNADGLLFWKN